MIQKLTGPKGFTYAEIDGLRLHSPYNPQREADRFIRAKIKVPPSKILLLGPGLGYAVRSCRALFPESEILAVYYHPEFLNNDDRALPDSILFRSQNELEHFLLSHLTELDLDALSVVEWPVSARAAPSISSLVNQSVKNVIQRLHGNFMTTDSFGKKYILNTFNNFLCHENIFSINNFPLPVVIAASGPSLESAAPFLFSCRDRYLLFSLPSSLEALKEYDIIPDAVIMSDPGFYAGFHSSSLWRNFSKTLPVIKTVSSFFSKNLIQNPTVFTGWHHLFESPFISHYYSEDYFIPDNGTVAGTAFEIALRWKAPAVFFAGLDFSYNDLLSHARPHPFYSYFLENIGRIAPFISELFKRKIIFDDNSRAYSIYAAWFTQRTENCATPIYRIEPSSVNLPGFTSIAVKDLDQLLRVSSAREPGDIFTTVDASIIKNRFQVAKDVSDSMLQKVKGVSEKCPIQESEPVFNFLFTINPIKCKLYNKAVREKDDTCLSLQTELIEEAENFLSIIQKRIAYDER